MLFFSLREIGTQKRVFLGFFQISIHLYFTKCWHEQQTGSHRQFIAQTFASDLKFEFRLLATKL